MIFIDVAVADSSERTAAMPRESSAPSAVGIRWQHTIETAFNEPDGNKWRERVYDAEAAIFSRLQELAQNWEDTQDQEERQVIDDACKRLWILKRDCLGISRLGMKSI